MIVNVFQFDDYVLIVVFLVFQLDLLLLICFLDKLGLIVKNVFGVFGGRKYFELFMNIVR